MKTENLTSNGRRLSLRRQRSLANQVLALTNKARALYQKKDDLFQQPLDGCRPGAVIETKQGRFEIVDNFAAKNVGYRPASFHRYELKEAKAARSVKGSGHTSAPLNARTVTSLDTGTAALLGGSSHDRETLKGSEVMPESPKEMEVAA